MQMLHEYLMNSLCLVWDIHATMRRVVSRVSSLSISLIQTNCNKHTQSLSYKQIITNTTTGDWGSIIVQCMHDSFQTDVREFTSQCQFIFLNSIKLIFKNSNLLKSRERTAQFRQLGTGYQYIQQTCPQTLSLD